jgi:hypothetical protein
MSEFCPTFLTNKLWWWILPTSLNPQRTWFDFIWYTPWSAASDRFTASLEKMKHNCDSLFFWLSALSGVCTLSDIRHIWCQLRQHKSKTWFFWNPGKIKDSLALKLSSSILFIFRETVYGKLGMIKTEHHGGVMYVSLDGGWRSATACLSPSLFLRFLFDLIH